MLLITFSFIMSNNLILIHKSLSSCLGLVIALLDNLDNNILILGVLWLHVYHLPEKIKFDQIICPQNICKLNQQ